MIDKFLDALIEYTKSATTMVGSLLLLLALAIYLIAALLRHKLGVFDTLQTDREYLLRELEYERRYAHELRQQLIESRDKEDYFKQYFKKLIYLYRQGKISDIKLQLDEMNEDYL